MMLEGKVAIVSGVGPGLGQATAAVLAREGATVVLVARDRDRLDEVRREITEAGGRAVSWPTDITDADAVERLVEGVVEQEGRVDVLVSSAFRPDPGQAFLDADLGRWRKVHEVNLWGGLALTQAVARVMAGAGGGSIVFVSSMVVRKAMANQGGYATSKGALHVAARVLARELAPHSIRVNSVVPGWMWGPNVALYVGWLMESEGLSEDEAKARIAVDIPQGRIPPQEDCAEAIAFLASDRAASITGQALDVNGGEVFH